MEEKKRSIALIQADADLVEKFINKVGLSLDVYLFENGLKFYQWLQKGGQIDAIVSAGGVYSSSGITLNKQLKSEPKFARIPFIILTNRGGKDLKVQLAKERIAEIFLRDFVTEEFLLRINWLIDNPISEKEQKLSDSHIRYKMPTSKRIFDIAVALMAILLLSPLFLLVILIIKLESKGPVFYIAKRVGRGYKIFDFYKFRSMRVGADAQMKDLAHLNQYKKNENESNGQLSNSELIEKEYCPVCSPEGTICQSFLYLGGNPVCEKFYLYQKKIQDEGKFIKFSNDPRVTKIGKFIRNTSIDELPQLFNVLKGDMSIVGNRPLPLYEAEKITIDEFNLRFMAPAGITGLWQVTKRGTSEMSELERMQLDNYYATNYSLAGDIKIMLRTIPALMQKENV